MARDREHATRFAMMTRSVNIRYRTSHSMSLPLFGPDIGNVFGQSRSYGPMSPGLDFAFRILGRGLCDQGQERGWLMIDDNQTSPSIWSTTNEFNLDIDLEPVRGLKIKLTNNRTDNHSNQVQFMYADMPTTHRQLHQNPLRPAHGPAHVACRGRLQQRRFQSVP